ncbi:GNAT family acetyltransferase [Sphingomonas sp. BAUL-RG-20F-R05-02]|uniref:GNAT family acetyltransferase n=1 Tax=Sphingomonas sp. BAUL-RG-20F-R05-02 TaxID=2914830 RepID=UPI001F55BF1C|nr:GNAT family acetyltransferase [Sphingomonas sp. BAUL-RG-20F-R05-02]
MIAATKADAAETVELWHACGLTRPWNDPHADFALALATSTSTILLARDGDTLIGSVMVGFDGHRGWIYYLAVAPNRRRGGIGRALMAAAEAWLAELDAPKVQLMVRDTNDAALGFYARLGYAPQAVVTLGRFLNGMVKP